MEMLVKDERILDGATDLGFLCNMVMSQRPGLFAGSWILETGDRPWVRLTRHTLPLSVVPETPLAYPRRGTDPISAEDLPPCTSTSPAKRRSTGNWGRVKGDKSEAPFPDRYDVHWAPQTPRSQAHTGDNGREEPGGARESSDRRFYPLIAFYTLGSLGALTRVVMALAK